MTTSSVSLDCTSHYLSNIGKLPLLSAEQEALLARKRDRGDQLAVRQLVEHNLRLVVSIARQFVSATAQIDDLIQEGNIGLIKAAEKYDPQTGVRFANYAAFSIKKRVRRAACEHRSAFRIPPKKWEEQLKIARTAAKLGPHATEQDIAQASGSTVDSLRTLRTASSEPCSFDMPRSPEDDTPLAECLAASEPSPDDLISLDECKQQVDDALNGLEQMLRETVELRYGLDGSDGWHQTQIGELHGISGQAVGKRERKALNQLAVDAPHLESFLPMGV